MLDSSFLWRLLLAIILGLLIGFEREYLSEKSAGTRTYALIVFSSCLFAYLSKFGFSDVFGLARGTDPSRIAAGIVVGVGFLGAGTIIVHKDKVIGLTTAASIWSSAAIGIALGLGFTRLAIFSTFLTIFVLLGIGVLEEFSLKKVEKQIIERKKD